MPDHTPPTDQELDLDAIEAAINGYRLHPTIGFNCCSAHPVADAGAALVDEVRRLRAALADTRVAALLEAAEIADETVPPDLPRTDRDQGRLDAAHDIRAWAADIKAIVESGHAAPAVRPAVETGARPA